jgi:hypothetical protein
MPRGNVVAFMVVVALAIALAELQVRREASIRYVCLALIWLILTGMLLWTAYGA